MDERKFLRTFETEHGDAVTDERLGIVTLETRRETSFTKSVTR